jgi:hypothetical protein
MVRVPMCESLIIFALLSQEDLCNIKALECLEQKAADTPRSVTLGTYVVGLGRKIIAVQSKVARGKKAIEVVGSTATKGFPCRAVNTLSYGFPFALCSGSTNPFIYSSRQRWTHIYERLTKIMPDFVLKINTCPSMHAL